MMWKLACGSVVLAALVILASCAEDDGAGGGATATPVIAVPGVLQLADGLQVLSDISYRPMEFYDGEQVEGNEAGLDVDLAHAIAALFGIDVRFEDTEFDGIIDALIGGNTEGDVIISSMTITRERSETIDFVPYLLVGTGILVGAGNPHEIKERGDLCGLRVAVLSGSIHQELAADIDVQCGIADEDAIDIVVLQENDLAIDAVASGIAEAYLNDLPVVSLDAARSGGRLEKVSTQLDSEPYGIGVRKTDDSEDSVALFDALCEAVTHLWDSGEYHRILEENDLTEISLAARPVCGNIVIPSGEDIVVGTSSALTGGATGERGKDYAEAARVSVSLWKERNPRRFAGHEIVVRSEDDGCSSRGQPERAAERLVRELRLVGVIGPQCSGGVRATKDIYAQAGVVMISGSATSNGLTAGQEDGFFFRTAYRNDLEAQLIAHLLRDEDRVYIARNTGSYGEDLSSSVAAFLGQLGIEVRLGDIGSDSDDIIQEIREIVDEIITDGSYDAVVFAGSNPDAHFLYQSLIDARYPGGYVVGDAAASESGFVVPVGSAANGVVFAGCSIALSAEEGSFLDLFESNDFRGQPPSSAFPAHFADATTILLDALASVAVVEDDGSMRIGRIALRDAVHETILQRTLFSEPLTGDMAFDAHGDRVPPNLKTGETDDASSVLDVELTLEDFRSFGLLACAVEDGKLVPLTGDEDIVSD